MKLIQLNLRAYGPFTNKVIEFGGVAEVGRPGLHIVLGANEAGKSTTLRALRAVLFGMTEMSDAHLHPKDFLRVGLKVQTTTGEVLSVERRKGKGARSLLFMDSDKPVLVEEWTRVLPVESADLFEQMFALNYERLLQGGKQLAEFKNDVGKTLLAASGDLGQTVTRMQQMTARAGAIYSPRATSSDLRKALAAYQDAEKAFRDERYTSREYKAAVTRRDELEEELKRISLERIRLTEDLNRLTRLQTAAPHVRRLLEDEKALEAFANGVLLAADFEQRYANALAGLKTAAERREDAASEVDRLNNELANVPRDSALAGMVKEIDRWKDLSGTISKARIDCPKREVEWKTLSNGRESLCARLGISVEATPSLLVEQRKRIELLANQKLVLDVKQAELPGKIANLESSLAEVEALSQSIPAEVDTTELAELLAQVRVKKQLEHDAKRLQTERDDLNGRLGRDVAAIPLWSGTAEQLEMLRVPLNASVSEFADRFVRHQTRSHQLTEDHRALTAEVEDCARRLDELEQLQSIPTQSELLDARATRDLGWTAIKDRWIHGLEDGSAEATFRAGSTKALPEVYEDAVVHADSLADRLRLEAERVERKRSAVAALELARQKLAAHVETIERHESEFGRLELEWKAIWADAQINPRTPKEMQQWLEERSRLVGQLRDLNRVNASVMEAEAEVKRWQELLGTALGESSARNLSDLVTRAEARVREAAENRKQRIDATTKIQQVRLNLEAARNEQRRITDELGEWRALWAEALVGLPVTSAADPAAAKEVLQLIDEVHTKSDEMAGLQYRIDAMKRDESDYVEAVRGLALSAGRHDLVEADALIVIGELQKLARAAQDNEAKAASISENLAREKRKHEEAERVIARQEATLEELRKEAQAPTVSSLPEVIRSSKAYLELKGKISEHRAALADSCGNIGLDVFIAQVQSANLDILPAELHQIRDELNTLEDSKAKYVSERDSIDREFQLREAATALSQAACQKFSAAARIDALTAEYLELQIGATLLTKAIALYREKNQDPLLKLAGDYFSTLTCGAFSALVIDDEGDQRCLRGVRSSNGAHLDLDAMSDGTRDQLFLALRLAYIETQCDKGMPCPVILDDVLMAFDDARTAAALRALRDLSRKTQVLVFTHHAHQAAIVEQTLAPSDFQLHVLAPTTANVLQSQGAQA
jgi:uncharacterized protein YhaN